MKKENTQMSNLPQLTKKVLKIGSKKNLITPEKIMIMLNTLRKKISTSQARISYESRQIMKHGRHIDAIESYLIHFHSNYQMELL